MADRGAVRGPVLDAPAVPKDEAHQDDSARAKHDQGEYRVASPRENRFSASHAEARDDAADADSLVVRQYLREPVRDQRVDVRLDPVITFF